MKNIFKKNQIQEEEIISQPEWGMSVHVAHNGETMDNYFSTGMEKYELPNFQILVENDPQYSSKVLAIMCQRAYNGEKFKDGDEVSGVYADRNVRLKEYTNGVDKVLRLIVQDNNGNYPEDKDCDEWFAQQITYDSSYKAEENKRKVSGRICNPEIYLFGGSQIPRGELIDENIRSERS